MLVRCKHFSKSYPTGGQRVGSEFILTKAQADYYKGIGWVDILPSHLQPKQKRGKRKKPSDVPAVDLALGNKK